MYNHPQVYNRSRMQNTWKHSRETQRTSVLSHQDNDRGPLAPAASIAAISSSVRSAIRQMQPAHELHRHLMEKSGEYARRSLTARYSSMCSLFELVLQIREPSLRLGSSG